MKPERFYYMDNLKVILIGLVVFGHYIEPLVSKTEFHELYTYIYTFHMPLFAFVSGFFSKEVSLKGIGNLIYKLLVYQLLFALLFSSVALYENGIEMFNHYGSTMDAQSIISYLLTPIWLLWYLLSLVFWKLLLFIFSKSKWLIPVAFIIGILIVIVPINPRLLSYQRTFALFPFFLIGFYTTRDQLLKFIDYNKMVWLAIILIIITFIIARGVLWNYDLRHFYYLYNYEVLDISKHEAIFSRILLYLQSILMIIYILLLNSKEKNKHSYIGERTFTIYIYHGVIYVLISTLGIYTILQSLPFLIDLIVILILTISTIKILSLEWIHQLERKNNIYSFKKKERQNVK